MELLPQPGALRSCCHVCNGSKDTPARREGYTKVAKCAHFPLTFCKHRWLENVPVTERIVKIWPKVTSYVKAVEAGEVSNIKTKSFDVMKECSTNILVQGKLSFVFMVAKQLNLFITIYQYTRQTGQRWHSCMGI